jgi:hypothetical protein
MKFVIDTTPILLMKVESLAFEACADLGVVPRVGLSEEANKLLDDARKAAERIKRLFEEEFITVHGVTIEREEPRC